MKTLLTALALAASLVALPVAAQMDGMGSDAQHAPGMAPGPAPAPGDMPMMQGAPMMGGSMMRCPMMGGGTGGMAMDEGPAGDQGIASLALDAANSKMHRDMAISFTGNVDVDFVRGMIAHHQGAIDMAKVVRAFGSDEQIRTLAENIIAAQEAEIAMMREWLSENAPQ